ncbi:MAG: lamin tail domain-containing protein [Calditrichota bacterium]
MKTTWKYFGVVCTFVALLVLPGMARADVTESFDGLSQSSYGSYDYNGFHLENALCDAIGATTGCVNPLPSRAVRIRNAASYLEYVGLDGFGKDGGVGVISFDYKAWDPSPTAICDVTVSIDGGAYTAIDGLTNNVCTEYAQYSYALNNASNNIKIKIAWNSGERMHIDNFSITDYGADVIPPVISSLTVISTTELDVLFNEDVQQASAETESNYVVTPGSVSPSSAVRDGSNLALVHLTFASAFAPNSYTLTVNGVQDIAGNPCVNETEGFFINPTLTAGDVVINEIMYDDTATTDVEWVEIYNRTASGIDISGWILQDDAAYPPDGGEGALEVPSGTTIAAGAYLVLCKTEMPEITGEVVCTQFIGSWALSNTGDNLALYTAATGGMLMDGTLDSSAWYPDLTMTQGNSIEKCTEDSPWSSLAADWHESTNEFAATGRYRYCTPGATNSVCGPDMLPPNLLYVTVISATELDAVFNEDLDQTTAETEANYVVTPGSVVPSSAILDGTNLALVHLTFASAFAAGDYVLTVNNVEDLNNNACTNETANFSISNITVGDVIITEVMYDDTAAQDSEWVEIHNRTANPIDISGWYLTDDDSYPALSGEGALIVPASTTLPAYGYVVLARADQPELTGEIVCTQVGSFGLNNGGDNLALYTAETGGTLVDGSLTVVYPDLSTPGYSIEKCDSTIGWTGDAGEWQESTNAFGTGRYLYCTPGAVNTECVPDLVPPELVSAVAVNNTIVDVTFTEDVEQTTAETVTNYLVDLGVGNPVSATRQGDWSVVRLVFGSAMAANTYTLTVNNVEDLAGNPILPGSQVQFTVAAPPAELIFTEIMPNPNFASLEDSLGEWFEIYNPSTSPVDISGWIIGDNSGADTLEGTVVVGALDYFVFGSNNDLLTNGGVPVDYEYKFAISGWGLSLSNTADSLTLKDASGQLAATLVYSATYPFGAGYSAQLRDLSYNPAIDTNWCRCDSVWVGATLGDRGTPGAATICGVNLPPQYRTLCDIREQDVCGIPTLLNQQVITQGYITYMDSCRRNAYIELNGCGVMIYGNAVRAIMTNSTRLMRVGDYVEVNGYITHYNGLTEYAYYLATDPVVTFISEGNPTPGPVVVSPAQISTVVDDCVPEAWESRYVAVAGLTFLAGDGVATFSGGTSGTNYYAVSGTDTVVVRVVPCDTIVGELIPVGPVSVTGILGQYDNVGTCKCGGYQLVLGGANPFAELVCADPLAATAIRMTGASADSVEIRWQPGTNQTCDCFKVYYSDVATVQFPAGYTLAGCVCNQTYYRVYFPANTRRYYVVTATDSCE